MNIYLYFIYIYILIICLVLVCLLFVFISYVALTQNVPTHLLNTKYTLQIWMTLTKYKLTIMQVQRL